MKTERFEVRGVTVAVTDGKCGRVDGALSDVIAKIEERFLAAAREHALSLIADASQMSPRERRTIAAEKISISADVTGGNVSHVVLTASLRKKGGVFSSSADFFYDTSRGIFIDPPRQRRKKTPHGSVPRDARRGK